MDTNEYSKINKAGGRRLRKNLRSLWRVVGAQIEKLRYNFQAVSQFGGTRGFFALDYSTFPGPAYCPCYVFDITGCVNNIGGTNVPGAAGYRLAFSGPTDSGVVNWVDESYRWSVEAGSHAGSTLLTPNGRSMLNWMSAKMMFYAPLQRPTKFSIELIQIHKTECCPFEEIPYGSTTPQRINATAFWQYMIKPYIFNPLDVLETSYRKYYRVIKRITFTMDPKETTESVNTRMKEVNFFQRFNRVCNYNWEQSDRVALEVDEPAVNLAVNKVTVTPRARIYLLIRALATKDSPDGGFNANRHPSFDIKLRTQHSSLS